MCVDCVLASPRIAQVDPGNEPLSEVVLSQRVCLLQYLYYRILYMVNHFYQAIVIC
jgi:hypothetical protein